VAIVLFFDLSSMDSRYDDAVCTTYMDIMVY